MPHRTPAFVRHLFSDKLNKLVSRAAERLGPYEILTLIDQGGLGEVYEARGSRLDRGRLPH
jgi:hypothetical protein